MAAWYECDWFCDYLAVSQRHPDSPLFVRELHKVIDPDSGVFKALLPISRVHQGKFGSKLNIASLNGVVRISGNPCAWSKPHNLFGPQVNEAVGIYNQVLRKIGLPLFELERSLHFTRIDYAQDFVVGPNFVSKTIRGLSTGGIRGGGALFSNAESVYWNQGSRFHSVKAYDKGKEMGSSLAGRRARKLGVVRIEHSFGNKFFRVQEDRKGAASVETRASAALARWNKRAFGRVDIVKANYDEVSDALVELGIVTPKKAADIQCMLCAWLHGLDVKTLYRGSSSFYESAKILRSIGYDILEPIDIARHNFRVETIAPRVLAREEVE